MKSCFFSSSCCKEVIVEICNTLQTVYLWSLSDDFSSSTSLRSIVQVHTTPWYASDTLVVSIIVPFSPRRQYTCTSNYTGICIVHGMKSFSSNDLPTATANLSSSFLTASISGYLRPWIYPRNFACMVPRICPVCPMKSCWWCICGSTCLWGCGWIVGLCSSGSRSWGIAAVPACPGPGALKILPRRP